MTAFFTSDTHFGHANVIQYCGRPFANREEMDTTLIERWNQVVTSEDTVYHLGDFAFGPKGFIMRTREQLHGRIILLKGNHDRSAKALREFGFDEVYPALGITLDGCAIHMQHKPAPLSEVPYCTVFLCGHVHVGWRRRGKTINVGVDQWDFTPRTLKELLAVEDDDACEWRHPARENAHNKQKNEEN